ncbi:MAG: SGNH/GDSL hydrolase family protein [Betaproteobacteria bacterium]
MDQASKRRIGLRLSTTPPGKRFTAVAMTILAVICMAQAPITQARDGPGDSHWVGTWSASPQAAGAPARFNGQTLREIVRVSLGGNRVRVRLSNVYGTESLVIDSAHLALRSTGASIAAGSDRVLTFGGSPSTTIPPGALAISDPVRLKVPDLGELAVSLYFAGNQIANTEHTLGLQTTYVSAKGDFTGADSLPAATTTQAVHFLTGIEVDAPSQSAAIVALGDSITDGYHSTADADRRWTNRLSERLQARKGASKRAVLNAGITGNRVLHNLEGTNALARLDRDVLVQSGARYLIVLQGINDIGIPGSATAAEIIAGHRQIIDRAHALGLKVYGGTLTPFQAYLPGLYYTPDGEVMRQAVNQWIRTSKAYDAVIDFDKALRDPRNPAILLAAYDSGDNLHPNDAGYKAMADAVDLRLFAQRNPGRRAVDPLIPSTPAGAAKAAPCTCAR